MSSFGRVLSFLAPDGQDVDAGSHRDDAGEPQREGNGRSLGRRVARVREGGQRCLSNRATGLPPQQTKQARQERPRRTSATSALSIEDDAEGTVNPADLAGTGGPDDDAVDGR